MRKTLICSLIGLVGCTWMAGCQDKPDGAQTIIIELADPSDQVEETKEEMPEESVSESDTEMETGLGKKVVSVNLNWRESRVCLDQRLIAMKRES